MKDRVSDEEQETEEGRRRDGEREREKDGRKERRDVFKDVVASRQALKAGDRRPPPPLPGILVFSPLSQTHPLIGAKVGLISPYP